MEDLDAGEEGKNPLFPVLDRFLAQAESLFRVPGAQVESGEGVLVALHRTEVLFGLLVVVFKQGHEAAEGLAGLLDTADPLPGLLSGLLHQLLGVLLVFLFLLCLLPGLFLYLLPFLGSSVQQLGHFLIDGSHPIQ